MGNCRQTKPVWIAAAAVTSTIVTVDGKPAAAFAGARRKADAGEPAMRRNEDHRGRPVGDSQQGDEQHAPDRRAREVRGVQPAHVRRKTRERNRDGHAADDEREGNDDDRERDGVGRDDRWVHQKWNAELREKTQTISDSEAGCQDASCARARSGVKMRGLTDTTSAPAVMPNIATEIATNAKWYHIVTLKIRVSRISYISVESAMRNTPA